MRREDASPAAASFSQNPLPVFDADDDAGTIVHAVVVTGIDAEHAVARGNVIGILQRVPQCAAKWLAARLALFQGFGNRALQQYVRVPRMAAEGRPAPGAGFFFG